MVWGVDHHFEAHQVHAKFLSVFDCEVSRVVWAVEVLSLAVAARSGVVSADDEVGRAVVLSDNGVPYRFSRSAHSHGKREDGQISPSCWVLRHDSLVALHTGVVVNIARLRLANDSNQTKAIAKDMFIFVVFPIKSRVFKVFVLTHLILLKKNEKSNISAFTGKKLSLNPI